MEIIKPKPLLIVSQILETEASCERLRVRQSYPLITGGNGPSRPLPEEQKVHLKVFCFFVCFCFSPQTC